jgi:hypothetical protein
VISNENKAGSAILTALSNRNVTPVFKKSWTGSMMPRMAVTRAPVSMNALKISWIADSEAALRALITALKRNTEKGVSLLRAYSTVRRDTPLQTTEITIEVAVKTMMHVIYSSRAGRVYGRAGLLDGSRARVRPKLDSYKS